MMAESSFEDVVKNIIKKAILNCDYNRKMLEMVLRNISEFVYDIGPPEADGYTYLIKINHGIYYIDVDGYQNIKIISIVDEKGQPTDDFVEILKAHIGDLKYWRLVE